MEITPSNVLKVISLWHGLTVDQQIQFLSELDKKKYTAPSHLLEKIRINALDSKNPYVRYLAAKEFYFPEDCSENEKILRNKIKNDPDPLVKNSLLEPGLLSLHVFDDLDEFFSLPQDARLAIMRTQWLITTNIEPLFIDAVEKYLPNGMITKEEIIDLMLDFLLNPEFQAYYAEKGYEGLDEYHKGEDTEKLWRLISKLPKYLSHILIKYLPAESGLRASISSDVIDTLNDEQLIMLLQRKNVGLEDLRKEIFWREINSKTDLSAAASSCNFNLTSDEFSEILLKPEKDRDAILEFLGLADDITIVISEAIIGLLEPYGAEGFFLNRAHEKKINQLKAGKRVGEILALRIYRLAKYHVPEKGATVYPLGGKLEFMSDKIIAGDIWQTYIGFIASWREAYPKTNYLDKHLPRIEELNEYEHCVYEDEESKLEWLYDSNTRLKDLINNNVSDLEQEIKLSGSQNSYLILKVVENLKKNMLLINENYNEHLNYFRSQVSRFYSFINIIKDQKYFLYFLGSIFILSALFS